VIEKRARVDLSARARPPRFAAMSAHSHAPKYSGILQTQPGLIAIIFTVIVGGIFVGALKVQWDHAQHEHEAAAHGAAGHEAGAEHAPAAH
jgi:hypothetical protein